MLNYNSNIKYNEPLVTYDGIIIQISEAIVVNSETVSTLEIINIPAFAAGETTIYDYAAHALSSLINDISPDGDITILVDKENSHATIDMSNGIDVGPEGTFSITIISNI